MKKEKSNAVRPRGHALGRLVACFFCLFLGTMALPLQAQDQNMPRVSLDVNNGRLIQVIEILRGMTRYNFMFNSDELRDVSGITLHLENVSLSEALDKLLKEDGRGFTYTIQGRTVVIRKESQQQLKSILFKGKVVDEKRLPLPGVTVLLAGTSIGTVTDANGKFRLEIPKQNKSELIFSFVGYKTCRKNITNLKDSVIVLEPDCCELEEVVSYGYYNVDKRKSTSAVTSLKADDILVMGKNSVDQLLEGHVPGMIFMQNSGQVGATPRIKIRGTTTVLGNQSPLWVVDGVILSDPVNIDPQQLNDLDFVNLLGNAISGINPEDIDQIDILKDASATAIYGPRASNGVIVITTKKGKIGKPSIRYSFSGTLRQRPYYTDRNVNVMNSQERIDFSRELIRERSPLNNLTSWVGYEAAYIDYYSGKISYEEFKRRVNEMETANTDWLGILLKNTFSHNHTVNVSGGDANVRYYTSVGYMDERGNIRGEKNKRYSLTSNLNMRFNRFSLQFSVRGSVQKKDYTPQAVGVTDYAYNTARSVSLYKDNGELRFYERENEGAYTSPFNILNEMNNSSDKINSSQLGLTLNLNYEISNSWTAGLTFAYNLSDTKEEVWYGAESWYVAKLKYKYRDESYFGVNAIDKQKSLCPTGGELLEDDTENEGYSLRAQMTYNTFLDNAHNHNLTINLIGELSSSKYEGFSITRRGFLKDRGMAFDEYILTDYPMYAQWLQTEKARGVKKHNLTNLLGLIGSITYSYKNSYVATANMRIDASNKFGDRSNEKLLPIWSVSGRWNMHENILSEAKWINTLALKMSYGYQGNMPETESPRLIIEQKGTDPVFEEFYSTIKYYPNPMLRWEKTSTYNVDLEFAFFNNKLAGSVGFYFRHTEDAFMPKSVSKINGISTYTINAGVLENKGVEFTLNFTPVNNLSASGDRKGFVWRVNPNFGSVINQLIDKVKPKDKVLQDKVTYQDYLVGRVLAAGRPVNTFYSYEYKGLNAQNGSAEFYNTEASLKEKYDQMEIADVYENVMVRSGQREPFLQGGISNYIGWNNFSFSFDLTYSVGSKVRLFKLYPNGGTPVSPEQNLRKELTQRWKNPGDELRTNVPATLSGTEWQAAKNPWWQREAYAFAGDMWEMYDNSNIRVVSGDYLKLQNVSLRYTVPDSFCRKLYLKSAYLTLGATNLFTICSKKLKGQDPASQSGSSALINMSLRPTYSLGFNISF